MIDLQLEAPLTFAAATRRPEVQKDGRKLHPSTLYRWSTRGVRGVVLESVLIGGTRCTTRAAVQRFLHRLTSEAAPTTPPSGRPRRYEEAARRLAKSGI